MFIDAIEPDVSALAYTPAEYRIKWATLPWEAEEAYKLRRAVFCVEQGVFVGDDRDDTDEHAQLLVALSCVAGMPEQVVGTVRIHETGPGVWFGSRLAVHAAFRSHGKIGSTLIRLAVSSAHALGCKTFLAHVQAQNVPLFRRLGWDTQREETIFGRPHHLMQARLEAYPPCATPRSGFVASARRAS
ncbi:Histone acetyltransferase HPA2 and related acetyltransferases [Caballeronia glathei]|jgi:putative N-acetyltransferase (TIGR04045 family)|uniref:Histone acetyltransferase n=1 Tax=Caballeronia glathei TaxID=60547 RepID=A0A069PFH0_9BURK|nr:MULTISPECIES: MSMEG_0567/Sll0786 family nitrogen starvation N-acetyltransferase [Burkholderiaceae]KDR39335.1 histone acetyltransferase [Caballeronia glathei]TCK35097.1 putative N-acetyltransferase (TIGR04045 family) [Paraburkholderia sp. BL8N3]CDY74969.1 Histone acetyltransferase HPA2 and related acetyltransferases [Caballeronia glathei]